MSVDVQWTPAFVGLRRDDDEIVRKLALRSATREFLGHLGDSVNEQMATDRSAGKAALASTRVVQTIFALLEPLEEYDQARAAVLELFVRLQGIVLDEARRYPRDPYAYLDEPIVSAKVPFTSQTWVRSYLDAIDESPRIAASHREAYAGRILALGVKYHSEMLRTERRVPESLQNVDFSQFDYIDRVYARVKTLVRFLAGTAPGSPVVSDVVAALISVMDAGNVGRDAEDELATLRAAGDALGAALHEKFRRIVVDRPMLPEDARSPEQKRSELAANRLHIDAFLRFMRDYLAEFLVDEHTARFDGDDEDGALDRTAMALRTVLDSNYMLRLTENNGGTLLATPTIAAVLGEFVHVRATELDDLAFSVRALASSSAVDDSREDLLSIIAPVPPASVSRLEEFVSDTVRAVADGRIAATPRQFLESRRYPTEHVHLLREVYAAVHAVARFIRLLASDHPRSIDHFSGLLYAQSARVIRINAGEVGDDISDDDQVYLGESALGVTEEFADYLRQERLRIAPFAQ